jgi:HEAT repeat protein
MSDQSWAEYRFQAFGEPYMVWHDGPDFAQFRATAQADPVTAERMLLQGLAETDPLAVQAIAEADFPEDVQRRMISALRAALDRTSSTFRVRVAEALTRLTTEQRWSSAIVDALEGGPFWGDRVDAAMALGRYEPTVELIAALMRAMRDEEYLVRYHAANALLRYGGSTTDVSEDRELFAQIANDSTPGTRMLAAARLAGAAGAALRLGASVRE